LLDAFRRGELESLRVPPWPRDILAQQIVAAVASREWSEDELFDRVRRAHPYRDLTRAAFDDLVEMLAGGFHTARGRRAALIHHDAVNRRLRPRRGSRLAAITSGGAIPDNADYRVILEPGGTFLGTLNEDFAIESQAGDIFQLGNLSWRILRVEQGRVLVADAGGAPPTIPFWLGEAPSRSPELSAAVSRLREEIDVRLAKGENAATDWLRDAIGLPPAAGGQIVAYLAAARAALGRLPTRGHLVLERFFDEAGDHHLVIHAPFGGRLNRAWGLALRKRMCRAFNFELQAAATEDAILMSLGPTHSFPPEDLFRMVPAESARTILAQAILDAPMFPIRWRWTVTRALAVLRFRGGRRVPPRLQRMQAEDLAAVAFPDQLACLENVAGNREIPDHPLVQEAMRDCLEEACDVTGLESLLRSLGSGQIRIDVRDLKEPSPLAHEIVNARPYAFLDDAPLEERRTQAVHLRRFLDAEAAADLGSLDDGVIERVRREAWPEARSADELHDGLLLLGALTVDEARAGGWELLLARLATDGRAALMTTSGGQELWVAAERLPILRAVHPGAPIHPEVRVPERQASRTWGGAEALVELLRSRLQGLGPVTARGLAGDLGLPPERIGTALGALEGEGFVLRGRFTPGATETEWCERGLLARIHRGTLDRLRREIRPVAPGTFLRFLLEWQRLAPGEQARGPEGLEAVLDQLEGYVAAAGAWEEPILASRVAGYDPAWLDGLCLSGRFVWGRARPPAAMDGGGAGPIRTTPIAILGRESLGAWMAGTTGPVPGAEARQIEELLEARGACFFAEIVAACALLPARVEAGLAELVGRGRVTSDTFTGLRALLLPSSQRGGSRRGIARRRTMDPRSGMDRAGRWSLLRPEPHPHAAEPVARALLRRYGVVFRAVLEREGPLPPWREMVRVLRRLEARGEIRGGRFVDGFTGEQYASPDAIRRLREVRRRAPAQDLVTICAADPTNLVGIVTPGERVPSQPGNRILLRDGTAVAVRLGETVSFLEDPGAREATVRQALRRRITPPGLRPFPGRRRP
ncbi:MAG: ATP-dependent DNA helicase, partial [Acidobacteriota bacterium]